MRAPHALLAADPVGATADVLVAGGWRDAGEQDGARVWERDGAVLDRVVPSDPKVVHVRLSLR